MKQYSVLFLPDNKEVKAFEGITIMEAAGLAGVKLENSCGGKGRCGKCMVRIRDRGKNNEQTVDYKKVLACRTKIKSDMDIEVPQVAVSVHRKNQINLFDLGLTMEVNPGIKKACVQISKPSLDYQVSDRERLLEQLNDTKDNVNEVCLEALRMLPDALRKKEHLVTKVLCGDKIIAVEAGDTTNTLCGVAVDLGTTSIVASLLDLNTGKQLSTASATNRQNIYGADVISRITYCMENKGGLEKLHAMVVEVINGLIDELCNINGITSTDIYQVTVVGNTTMTHLFTKLDPSNLALSPFIPVTTRRMVLEARDLGLHAAPHAQVHVLPNIAGFLGSDTVSVVLATGIHRDGGTKLVIDIGTNGEIVLAGRGEIVACSTAAGPAFEGAQIEYGMRAAEGAIEEVIIGEDVEIKTIGGYAARGICGSGLLDAVAGMIAAGIIDASGKIIAPEEASHLPPQLQKRLGKGDGGKYFVLATEEETTIKGPVLITQKDIRELQLAKGAIKAGIQILLADQEIEPGELDKILLAGTFGNYIKKESVITIGLLPSIAPEKIEFVGNAAGMGAQMALISENLRMEADRIAERIRHVELASHKDFHNQFIEALYF
ncbi:ASKHA domain-containing protein [Desulfoscipio geothermicus]|uniref:Uncharacterized 2Fe-2 and 4Fe-4S clusters-containing protein, contains DUF4445 domain n=1 Tax=Desulfoscipio geothermicus DSM 3669 TaxID=1121426 RepID=A0A1I6DEM0_9FIRM|nr:ASKHA domain-containing protein [Desulfoscipio geothermicus]SFR03847.1 Uncharacterized 2Fe-2 and 4Fe-4S clusters-containing protein, contains DUF4445 domain [Desulfoscipio geothermicus DSM 3669]